MKIYNVTNGGASWYVLARSERQAIATVCIDCKDSGYDQDEMELEDFTAIPESPTNEISLHCETKPIKHTIADWLVIYDMIDCATILGCSEF